MIESRGASQAADASTLINPAKSRPRPAFEQRVIGL